MFNTIPERDWKYMNRLQPEMLSTLCQRINLKALEILQNDRWSEPDRYRKLYHHFHDADKVVAECFDDWRRSTLFLKLVCLQRHDLLTPEQREHLSTETQASLKMLSGG